MGLDLPLDHFRLLGVSPATDVQTVLRTLQLRLDRAPDQGYTDETLRARADLLKASADLLSDGERRSAYEADLTALADAPEPLMPALEIPSSREVAGLLLLLEAGQPLDVFELASRCLQPPQAPALGSSREADLTLLAGEAVLAAAEDYRRERHYEVAARILQQGLQLLQRMGQLPEVRERIQSELEALAPFRVLDLLSRDPSASREREEGLGLLEQLVQRRGGLEGSSDDRFAPEDFQTFFKQIRSFLTVQEQVDLFDRWSQQGSGAAEFLASIALTASGFAQRKPERIAAARDRLQASSRSGIEPLVANLDLLLGDVDGAVQRFESTAGAELKSWAARQSDEPLGRLCAWCRDWLSRDVLPGYRDLEADPDLEAYFSDRDVTAWVEREDRRRGRSFFSPESTDQHTPSDASQTVPGLGDPLLTQMGFGGTAAFTLEPVAQSTDVPNWPGATDGWSPVASPPGERPRRRGRPVKHADDRHGDVPLGWGLRALVDSLRRGPLAGVGLLPAIAGLGIALTVGSWLVHRNGSTQLLSPASSTGSSTGSSTVNHASKPPVAPPPPGASVPPKLVPQQPSATGGGVATSVPANASAKPTAVGNTTAGTQHGAAPPTGQLITLTTAEPDEAQLRALLETWLQAKTTVLSGQNEPNGLDRIARDGPLQRLKSDRERDRSLGQTQSIQVKVEQVAIRDRTPHRIALVADLQYTDSTQRQGREVNHTKPTTLRNVYVFGRDGDTWRLAASGPAR